MTDIDYATQSDQPPVNGDLMAQLTRIGCSKDPLDVEAMLQATANMIGYRAALLGEPAAPRLARIRDLAERVQAMNCGAAGRA